jgi:glycolate oxidase FAD binding subunit
METIGTEGPVVAAGGRTQWDIGGAVEPAAREVRAPAGIVSFVAAEMTVRAGAGTTVADLDAALEEAGQCVAMPPWPDATIGGVLAVGHSGLRRLGWGPIRDVLLEARCVSADGRLVVAGGPTVKNVSGYDLCRVLVGSLGTLAIIGEVVLRTRPIPTCERWLAGETDPFTLRRRLRRPAAILWDGVTTWVLLDGHPADVAEEAARTGLAEVERPPRLPRYRRSMRPSEIPGLAGSGWIAEVGVGVVHQADPPPPRAVGPEVAELHHRIKTAFDPTGRLSPGRSVLA